ncbi:MAG: PAS domain-containing protein, partial [Anaerolineae bacterium]|nr:PAS domain-containing protein [Anaerolineae bacterium]
AFNFQFALVPWRWALWAHTLFEHVSYSLSIATICYFALVFPVRHPLIDRYPRLMPLALYLAYPLIIGGIMLLAPSLSLSMLWGSHASWVLALTQIAIAMVAGFRSARVARDPVTRAQVSWIVWCAVVGTIVLVPGYVLPLVFTGQPWLPHPAIMVFMSALPIVLAVTILRYRLFDIEIVINRSLVYGTLTLLLAGIYLLLVRVLTLFIEGVARTEKPSLVVFVSTLVIALAFTPLRNQVQRWIDRAFYRTKVDLANLVFEMSERLAASIVLEQLSDLLTRELPSRLGVEWAVLAVLDAKERCFVPWGRDALEPMPANHPAALFMSQYGYPVLRLAPPPDLPEAAHIALAVDQVELAVPLISGQQLVGMYVLGAKRSGRGYNREDVRLFHVLGQQIAVSVQNARLYQKVEIYSQTLESQVRQRTEELQKAYRYLAQQHTTLNVILENIADGLVVTDLDHQITRLNRVFANMMGDQTYQDGESALVGQVLSEVLPDPAFGGIIAQALSVPFGIFSTNIVLSEKTYRASACALRGKSYPVGGVVIVFRDISYEIEMAQMKDDFVSNVTHELRTPLTSIIGFASLIEYQVVENIEPLVGPLDEKGQRSLERIEHDLRIIVGQGERLNRLIDSLLDLSKLEAGRVEWKTEPVYVLDVIEQSMTATQSLLIDKPVSMRVELEPNLPLLMGDYDRLIQVLTNLLSNSVKYTDQGEIEIRAWLLQMGDDISPFGLRQPNANLRLPALEPLLAVSVTDTGTGIAPQHLPYVFERFRQVGEESQGTRRKGTGLGLPISQEIVEHHGGQLWVESELGRGSRFIFTLRLDSSDSRGR